MCKNGIYVNMTVAVFVCGLLVATKFLQAEVVYNFSMIGLGILWLDLYNPQNLFLTAAPMP